MADNVDITPGTGKTIATDDIGGVQYQRTKITLGADGVSDGDVSTANPMPVGGTAAHDAAVSGNPALQGGVASAAAPTDVSADGDAVRSWHLRNGAQAVQLTYSGILASAGNGASGTGVLRVTLADDSTGQVIARGTAAADAAVSGNPVSLAMRASTAVPTAMSADGDVVHAWANRNGANVATMAPHVGLNSDPWNLVHEGAQYTSAQTSTVLVAGGASEKIVVTKVQIQVYGVTAGTAVLYFGTGAYSRGTNRALFDGEFAPSTTNKPGVVLDGPFIAGTNGDDLMITTTNALSITVSVWYYVVT